MKQWYIDAYGQENLDLLKFVEFVAELRPEALMACRSAIETTLRIPGFDSVLGGVSAFAGVHTYTALAYQQGILYEIISARHGATKDEVTDVLSLAWLHSGTVGVNKAAEVARDYMRRWDPNEPAPGMPFPAGWARDPDAFRSGLDFTDITTITGAELHALQDWYWRVQGAVPAYVPFLARQRPDAVRRAAAMAKAFGVSKGQVLHTLATAQRYLGDLFTDSVFGPIADLFEHWD